MTIEIMSAVTILSVAFAIFSGAAAIKRNHRTDSQKEASTMTTVIVKLENISAGISEIKTDLSSTKAEVRDMRDKLIMVEASEKSDRQRIEALEARAAGEL